MASKSAIIIAISCFLIAVVIRVDGQKRNERPVVQKTPAGVDLKTSRSHDPGPFTHIYEFTQPDFMISSLIIRHDDNGRGDISFSKKGSDESITDPIQLSDSTLQRLAATLAELDFLNSTENYQYEKDYSHLGNLKFTLVSGERRRTVTFNWTENKGAKSLKDEYRRIGNQYVWFFDVNLARQNQPLEAPKLLDLMEGYIRRGEISDQVQIVEFLEGLDNDERIPLMARNHAAKLIKQLKKLDEKVKN
jgi:hypothetical protein